MADQADVMDTLQDIAVAAIYPGAPGQSITGRSVDVGQGWPQSADLDKALRAGRTMVSIYAVPSTAATVEQPFNTTPALVSSVGHGLTATIAGSVLTVGGAPHVGEYLVLVGVRGTFSQVAAAGDTALSVAIGLAGQLSAVGLGTYADPSTIVFASGVSFEVRQGAPVTLADRVHRERQQFRIVVWAPTPADRAAIARAIDVALKRSIVIRLPDTTQAVVTYQGSNLDDKYENALAYRRDLIFNVMWDTIDTFQAFETTSVGIGVQLSAQPTL